MFVNQPRDATNHSACFNLLGLVVTSWGLGSITTALEELLVFLGFSLFSQKMLKNLDKRKNVKYLNHSRVMLSFDISTTYLKTPKKLLYNQLYLLSKIMYTG